MIFNYTIWYFSHLFLLIFVDTVPGLPHLTVGADLNQAVLSEEELNVRTHKKHLTHPYLQIIGSSCFSFSLQAH